MSFVIRLVELGSGVWGASVEDGMYLRSFDADAHDGIGTVEVTEGTAEAMRFNTIESAWALWKTQSTVRPLRPDGKPNRPLTAWSITVEPLAD